MAKGRIIDKEVKLLIARKYRDHPDWPAKMIKAAINKELKQDWPGLSAIQKELSKIKERVLIDNPEDKTWCVANYFVPPETLPIILKVKKLCIEESVDFTIRYAKWTARLSALVPESIPDIKRLLMIVSLYSFNETMCELIGEPFDSSELDKILMHIWKKENVSREELYEEWKQFEQESNELIEKIENIKSNNEGGE